MVAGAAPAAAPWQDGRRLTAVTESVAHDFRPGLEFDVAALAAYLSRELPGFQGPLQVRQCPGGQSNPTYRLLTPRHSYVLRRKPPGQ